MAGLKAPPAFVSVARLTLLAINVPPVKLNALVTVTVPVSSGLMILMSATRSSPVPWRLNVLTDGVPLVWLAFPYRSCDTVRSPPLSV